MDLNNASYYEPVRIPGIGKKGAGKISRKRKKFKISSADDLSRLKISAITAIPDIIFNNSDYQSLITEF
ncbi:MAG: hypothetical protein PHI15_01400 [Methanomicrobium sp.]|nr:hypothetical protein [Methanomicrobium sp.]